jgi:hypothetical protein
MTFSPGFEGALITLSRKTSRDVGQYLEQTEYIGILSSYMGLSGGLFQFHPRSSSETPTDLDDVRILSTSFFWSTPERKYILTAYGT